jgi:tetratricopeptide (TPR) repeat protein
MSFQKNLLPASLALLLGACATAEKRAKTVEWHLKHMQYEQAVELAAREASARPNDAKAQDLHRRASVALLLERGRRLTLDDQDVEALRVFQQAQELAPASAEVASWIDKTRRKLSDRWLQVGLELHSGGEIEAAVAAYEQCLALAPADSVALAALNSAMKTVEYRGQQFQRYFQEGVVAMSDYWLERARSRFEYAAKYKPEEERTAMRSQQVRLMLARQRLRVAEGLEEAGLFGAARGEYRMALDLAPDDAEAQAALERCSREVEAQRLLEMADYEMLRRNYDRAGEYLTRGEELTQKQKERFEGARASIQESRHEDLYQIALALEKDQRYPEAVEKYQELLDIAQYYKDVFTRRDTLQAYVELAASLHAKAKAATTDAERIDLLQQIEVFWPDYSDVKSQLETLRRAVPAVAPEGNG